jgi:hypothetical protein
MIMYFFDTPVNARIRLRIFEEMDRYPINFNLIIENKLNNGEMSKKICTDFYSEDKHILEQVRIDVLKDWYYEECKRIMPKQADIELMIINRIEEEYKEKARFLR